jgi:hypothetical protein
MQRYLSNFFENEIRGKVGRLKISNYNIKFGYFVTSTNAPSSISFILLDILKIKFFFFYLFIARPNTE